MSRLFLLEALVFKVHLENYGETINSKDDISINVRFSDFLNVDISPEYFPVKGEKPIVQAANLTIDLNMGKTYLFNHDPNELIMELKTLPLELIFRINRKSAGTALIPWKSEFSDMVKIYETIGVVKSVEYDGSTGILEDNTGKVGSVDVFLRLSCFGTSIETDFRMNPATEEFVFMNPRTMATFKCMNFDPHTDAVTPISSIYQPALNVPVRSNVGPSMISWTELFGGGTGIDAKLSVAPMTVDDDDFFAKLGANHEKDMEVSRSGFDMVSMVFRPPENKFFDFLNLMSAEVATKEEETMVTLTLDKQPNKKFGHSSAEETDGNGRKATFADVVEKKNVDDPLELTAEKIAKKLCKNKDCPAARKFKEFGIGPLATGAGLGTLYDNVEPPVSYGLSHTYGTLANYGPYGVFMRPKDPNQPFIPRRNPPEIETCYSNNAKPCCNDKLKLRGGCLGAHEFLASRLKCPIRLRLRGGGPKEHELCCLKNMCTERKPVFDLFGQILATKEAFLESYHKSHCSLEANHTTGRSLGQQEPVLKSVNEILPLIDLYCLNFLFLGGIVWKQFYRNPLGSCLTHDNAFDLYLRDLQSIFPGNGPTSDQQEQIVASNKKPLSPCQPNNNSLESNDVTEYSASSELPRKSQCDEIPIASSMSQCSCDIPNSSLEASSSAVLRLKGGGPVDLDLNGPKSPFLECKPVMDQFDQILAAYKKAIGPCGEATCPYAQNAAEVSCKKFCEQKAPPEDTKDTQSVSCDSIPCGMESCPYTENKNKFPAGCGSPKCAYTKYKLGLVDEDAALELQFLPPAISGKCGHPKCKYPYKPDLPPIHWDCPEPLPKGNCKNPQCPFLPPDLKALKCPGPPKKGPCGSTNCPYALPPPCDLPSCPFRQKPCPFLEQQQKNLENPSCTSSSGDGEVCENPDCPFSKKGDDESACFEDPSIKGEFTQCASPNCPFARGTKPKEEREECKPKKPKKKPKVCGVPKKSPSSPCGNPDCPFTPTSTKKKGKKKKKPRKSVNDNPDPSEKADEICDNPECPSAQKPKMKKADSICDNPTCPYASKKRKSSKTKDADSICPDPACPYASKKRTSSKTKDADSICPDPACPYASKKSTSSKMKDADSICENPTCPYASKKSTSSKIKDDDSICDNPSCPYASKKSTSSKTKDADSICDNPTCPYASKKSTSSSSSTDDTSEDSSTSETESTICNDPYCPYVQPLPSCGIPNCPYEPVPILCRPRESPPRRNSRRGSSNSKKEKEEELMETMICEDILEGEGEGEDEGLEREVGEEDLEELSEELKPSVGKKRKKKRGKFVYSTGDRYPGVKVGHKECVTPMFNVPPDMGWLWNNPPPILRLKPRRGWKPGAIIRTIANRIKAHRKAKGLGILQVPQFRKDKKGSGSDDDINVTPKPTLHIQKKDGSYWITMNPLKDPKTLADNEDPYMECTPMQFRITKKKRETEGENDSKLCCCEDENETSSSSDSELDIEFTPPAGIIHPERFKKKKNVIHCDTQYDPIDFEDKTKKGKDGKKGKKADGKKGKKGDKGKGKKDKGGKDKSSKGGKDKSSKGDKEKKKK